MECPRTDDSPTSLMRQCTDEYNRWANIVEAFSHAHLTHLEDRLPAIGGIAQRLAQQKNTEYLAGFMREELPASLIWSRSKRSLMARRIEPYVAPTWSWASLRGEILFQNRCIPVQYSHVVAEIVDAQIEYVSAANKYGQLDSAALTLTAPLFKLRVVDDEEDFYYGNRWSNAASGLLMPCDPNIPGGMKLLETHVMFDASPIMQERKDLKYVVITVCSQQNRSVRGYSQAGLVLKPAGDKNESSNYVRVGMFLVLYDGPEQRDWEQYQKVTITIV